MTRWAKKIIAMASACPAVAFDVFGTLLFRDVATPGEVFDWLEQSGGLPSGFAAQRRRAEAEARAVCPRAEVTLAEIYSRLPGLDAAAEQNAERRVVTANRELRALCHTFRAEGKKLYVVSDMYLPAAQIAQMLADCGFPPFDKIYVSCQYGVQKRSGKLFLRLLQEERLSARDVLFVGDDFRADYAGAALAGIHAELLPAARPLGHTEQGTDLSHRSGAAFLQNRIRGANPAAALGIEVLTPLLLGFCGWLTGQHQKAPETRLVLLARDMSLTCRALQRLCPKENPAYLKVSRKSLCPALLLAKSDPGHALLLDALPRQVLRAEQIAAYCGFELTESIRQALPAGNFDLHGRPAQPATQMLLEQLCHLAEGEEGERIRQQAAWVRCYLEDEGMTRPGTLLVDIGSGGTTQRILETILNLPLHGLYLACDERLYANLPRARADVYLFEGKPAPLWYWMGQPLLEYLISEPCGPTIGYYAAADGHIHPCVADGAASPAIPALQNAVLDALADWRSTLAPWHPTPQEAIAPFLSLVRHPSVGETRTLGDFVLEDGVEFPLAKPRALGWYLAHPGRFGGDFSNSRWKVGFLKRLLGLPLPYDQWYARAKNR